jgi:hypothetical protein
VPYGWHRRLPRLLPERKVRSKSYQRYKSRLPDQAAPAGNDRPVPIGFAVEMCELSELSELSPRRAAGKCAPYAPWSVFKGLVVCGTCSPRSLDGSHTLQIDTDLVALAAKSFVS